jgi:hypothetical protein
VNFDVRSGRDVSPVADSWQTDLVELLSTLEAHRVPFLVVGAYALARAGHLRATKDLDLWVPRVAKATENLAEALSTFLHVDVTNEEAEGPFLRFFAGHPGAFDVLRELPGVRWKTAWRDRSRGELFGKKTNFLGRRSLIRNKRAVGRLLDLADVEELLRLGPK